MPYNPRTIILLNFGRYSKEGKARKSHLPSIAQIPLTDPEGFGYVSDFLSNPEKTDRIIIESGDLDYIKSVAGALEGFPVNVRCEGRSGECREKSDYLVLPYSRDRNWDEKIRRGGPQEINNTHVLDSSFRCQSCAEDKKYEKVGKVLKLEISFKLPDILTNYSSKLEWNVNRGELHGKLKKIAWMLTEYGLDDMIDPRKAHHSRPRMDWYSSHDIISRLLKIPEDEIPDSKKGYEVRKLRWHRSQEHKSGQFAFQFA